MLSHCWSANNDNVWVTQNFLLKIISNWWIDFLVAVKLFHIAVTDFVWKLDPLFLFALFLVIILKSSFWYFFIWAVNGAPKWVRLNHKNRPSASFHWIWFSLSGRGVGAARFGKQFRMFLLLSFKLTKTYYILRYNLDSEKPGEILWEFMVSRFWEKLTNKFQKIWSFFLFGSWNHSASHRNKQEKCYHACLNQNLISTQWELNNF